MLQSRKNGTIWRSKCVDDSSFPLVVCVKAMPEIVRRRKVLCEQSAWLPTDTDARDPHIALPLRCRIIIRIASHLRQIPYEGCDVCAMCSDLNAAAGRVE